MQCQTWEAEKSALEEALKTETTAKAEEEEKAGSGFEPPGGVSDSDDL